jgi:hypothetical protein
VFNSSSQKKSDEVNYKCFEDKILGTFSAASTSLLRLVNRQPFFFHFTSLSPEKSAKRLPGLKELYSSAARHYDRPLQRTYLFLILQ